jgi:predicted esterase
VIRSLALVIALLASHSGAFAATMPPILRSRPTAAAAGLGPGETQLRNAAVAYRPASAAGPLALIVLIHGAGGYPPHFLEKMEPVADQLGAMLVAPHSVGPTWDLVEHMAQGDEPWGGPDAYRLDEALGDLFKRAAVDPSRIVLLGFSDGASYALSLGLANPKLFSGVIALSPGMYAPPRGIDRAQRVFIAHGRSDHVLPFAATSDIVQALRDQGADVRFRPFDGDHQIDAAALTEGLEWVLGPAAPGRNLQP